MEFLSKDDDEISFIQFNHLLLQHIEKGNNAEILAILKDINLCQITNNSGDTLLHYAAGYGNAWFVQYLIDLGANLDAQNNSKETPLMFAVQNHKIETVKLLLDANAEIFILDSNGKCVLTKAFNISRLTLDNICNSHEIVKDYREFYISENIVKIIEERVAIEFLNGRYVDDQAFHMDYPLYIFISMKNIEIIRFLLAKGSSVDAKDPETGDTSLHIAVDADDLQKIQLLLGYNADLNVKNNEGKTPLALLSFFRDRDRGIEILKLLMAAGADLIDRDRRTILVDPLLSEGNKEIVRSMLKHGIDLHFVDESGFTPLHILAVNKNPEVLAELRDFDFPVNIRMKDEISMLHQAAFARNASSIKFLLSRGADVNATCSSGHTPLCDVFRREYYPEDPLDCYEECVEILLAGGADPRIITDKNYERHWLNQKLSSEFIRLMNPILIHLSAVDASGRDIGEIMRNAIQTEPQFKEVFDSKKGEVEEMREVQLGKSVTLLDFVVASQKDISLYARNRRIIIGTLDAIEKDTLDPCYQRKLRESSLEFNKLIELRKKSVLVIYDIIGKLLYNVPVYVIAEKIVDYLEDHELYKLLGITS